jgi:hypothetical protein
MLSDSQTDWFHPVAQRSVAGNQTKGPILENLEGRGPAEESPSHRPELPR